jgi:hypothetical protein
MKREPAYAKALAIRSLKKGSVSWEEVLVEIAPTWYSYAVQWLGTILVIEHAGDVILQEGKLA